MTSRFFQGLFMRGATAAPVGTAPPVYLYLEDGTITVNTGPGSPTMGGYGPPLVHGSIVTVDLDLSRSTLRFYVDGVDQGIAFRFDRQEGTTRGGGSSGRGIMLEVEPLFPLVVFGAVGDSAWHSAPQMPTTHHYDDHDLNMIG